MLNDKEQKEILDILQDCNINFLIGSGMSAPYLSTLGNIEGLLSSLSEKLENEEIKKDKANIIRASLCADFFKSVILNNIKILEDRSDASQFLENYKFFLKTINSILLNRRNTILRKQINIFTTNFDIFLEKSLDELGLEYNDGFYGRFNLIFRLTNFRKIFSRISSHYDNISEIPTFNLVKLHGSLTWKKNNDDIVFSSISDCINGVKEKLPSEKELIKIGKKDINTLIKEVQSYQETKNIINFIEEYNKFLIINPNKEKFRTVVLNRNYYELLRICSNELEKENTVLFVMGFSFSDEHIRSVITGVANSNPTLKIFIFSYNKKIDDGVKTIKKDVKNNNVIIISPERLNDYYGFKEINILFKELLKKIN